MKKIVVLLISVFCFIFTKAQTTEDLQKIANLLSDAVWYSDKYITPATDGAVYQASSGWLFSPKKQDKWKATIGLHGNLFFVPKNDRTFEITNNDFKFFQIEGATLATVPTALGNDTQYFLTGEINGQQIRLKTPEGVNQETVIYPYLQGSFVLPYGFEVMARYSTKTKLKKGDYQVYGFGLKHNFSHYFEKLISKKVHLAAAVVYSKEDINFDFLDVATPYGNLGITQLSGLVDTYHFMLSASKEINKIEIITNLIVNTSSFEYKVSGEKGQIENVIPIQEIINTSLKDISKDKTNFIGEVSGRYQINKFFIQSTFAFGKFVNANLGVQYQIN